MTKQETFNTSAVHLLKQGERSIDDGGQCMYRDHRGRMCAAGVLIPNELYNVELEGGVVGRREPYHSDRRVDRLFIELGMDVGLVSDLQAVHDTEDALDWEQNLRSLAKSHNLDCDAIDTWVIECG